MWPLILTLAAGPAVTSTLPRVEVAFVLDTTGSMGGLIEGAKRRIWSIARRIGEGQPRPELRIALVGYRDRGDQYVTLVHDFSGDMDEISGRLMAFQAGGGGDTPEHVSAALSDAVHRLSWSQGRGLRMIFLVGDAPPHLDYQDGYDYRRHAREARQKSIAIETIQCGVIDGTEPVWREIASLAGGDYARIDADGGMNARVTPVDDELAALNRELGATVVPGGSRVEREASRRRLEARAAMPAPVAAEAAGYFAKAGRLAEKDLVDMPRADQKRELEAMRPGEGPRALEGKTQADALAYLQAQKGRREQLQAKIAELQKRRETYLRKTEGAPADGFDERVYQSIRKRAAERGIGF